MAKSKLHHVLAASYQFRNRGSRADTTDARRVITLSILLLLIFGGCATTIDPSGNISSETKSISEVLPTIKVGATTKDELIRLLGEPSSQSMDSSGMETAVFAEKVPFWKAGGMASLLSARQKQAVLIVVFQNGVVSQFQEQETWISRTPPRKRR